MAKLLVIDDEPNIVFSFEQCLASPTLEVLSAGTGRAGVEIARKQRPDAVLLDIRLPDRNGIQVFEEIHACDPRLPVVLMTAFARSETAIEAMSRGAFDYILKPVDLPSLRLVIERALDVSRRNRTPAVLADDSLSSENSDLIIGRCPAMQEVYKSIGRIAAQDAPVLILGESGTGKELVARAIYHYSARQQQAFLAINCAALPESLLESELFGHEKGAFTGADQRRIGKFEQVHGGTILLDEIGDMTPSTQAKALRVLQEQRFERVGGNASVQTDVRILAATNQDLPRQVQEGKFRLDLFYRLNGFTIHLPPLRERRDDIPLLAQHFLRKANREFRRHVATFSPDALQALVQHAWPGNIRELQSAVRYAVIQTAAEVVTLDSLPLACRAGAERLDTANCKSDESFDLHERTQRLLAQAPGDAYRRLLQEIDARVLAIAWQQTAGNQAHMAELLGVSRMTLRAKLRAAGLLRERLTTGD